MGRAVKEGTRNALGLLMDIKGALFSGAPLL